MQASDMDLVREFAASNSDTAFATLVERHINLVYSAALRRLENSHEAEEVAQVVFIILAKKAGSLRQGTILSGWLYQTAELTAANFLRTKLRRERREQEAFMQSDKESPTNEWPQVSAFLEDAMSRLRQKERDAIVLRFFENRTIAEVATTLGLGEAAAQKRVNRATDKLRNFFAGRGVHISNNGMLTSIGNHAVQVAPAGLASSVAIAGMTKGAAATGSTLTLLKGALKVMAWSKTKTTFVGAAIALLLGIGGTAVVVNALLPVPDVQGTWEGTLTIRDPGYGIQKGDLPKKRYVLRITETNDRYQASMDDIDGAHQGVEFDKFTYKYPYVHGEITPDEIIPEDVSATGKVNRSGEKMSWRVLEGTNAYAMVFARTTNPTPFPEPLTEAEFAPRAGSDLQGFWVGQIGRGKGGLRIQTKIAEASDGTFRADFYCLGQNTNLQPDTLRQPMAVSYDGTTVKLTTMAGFGMFEGRLRNGSSEMAGNWIQGGYHTPTTLIQTNYYQVQGAK